MSVIIIPLAPSLASLSMIALISSMRAMDFTATQPFLLSGAMVGDSMPGVTMQAISGAGIPGLPSATIMENVIPHIGGEEEKMEKKEEEGQAQKGQLEKTQEVVPKQKSP